MSFLFGAAALMGLALLPAILFQKQLDQTLAMTLHGVILLLYCFGLAGDLRPGVWVVLLLGFGAMAWYALRCLKQRSVKPLRALCTPGMVVFGVALLLFMALLRGRLLTEWDEFSHWGLVVKNMFLTDAFATTAQATTYFKGYPPAAALLEYFFVRMGRIVFTESYLYRAMDFYLAALLVSCFDRVQWKNWPGILLRSAVMFLLPMAFYSDVYTTVYVDALLGVQFAWVLYQHFSASKYELFRLINVGMGLCVLTLTKAAGTGLAALALLIIGADLLLNRRALAGQPMAGRPHGRACRAVLIALLPLCILVSKQSWQLHLQVVGASEAWETSSITLAGFIQLFTPQIPAYRAETLCAFWQHMTQPQPFGQWQLSPLSWYICLLAAGALAILIQDTRASRRRMLALQGGLALSFAVYTLSLLVLYLFTYSEYEARSVASFDRYMGTFLLGYALINAAALGLAPGRRGWQRPMAAALVMAGVLTAAPLAQAGQQLVHAPEQNIATQQKRQPFEMAQRAAAQLDPQADRVYFVCQHSNGYEYWATRFTMTPVHLQEPAAWSLGEAYGADDIWTRSLSADQWAQALQEGGYTYVYLYRADPQFCRQYGSLFAQPEQIVGSLFYRIEPQPNGKIQLVLAPELA